MNIPRTTYYSMAGMLATFLLGWLIGASPVEPASVLNLQRPDSPAGKGSGRSRVASEGAAANPDESARRWTNAWTLRSERLLQEQRLMEELSGEVTAENAPAIAKALLSDIPANDPHRSDFLGVFLRAWVKVAGTPAMDFAARHYGTFDSSIIRAWAEVDLAAAQSYTASHQSGGYHAAIMDVIAETDVDAAITYSREHFAEGASPVRLTKLLLEHRGVDGVESWLTSLNEPAESAVDEGYLPRAVEWGLKRMCYEDSARAREWVLANAGQPFMTPAVMEAAVNGLRDLTLGPVPELSLLVALPEPDAPGMTKTHSDLLGNAFGRFVSSDFDAAGQWLAEQSLSPRFDRAIQDYAVAAAPYDPDAARVWAEQIDNEAMRAETLARMQLSEPRVVTRP